MVYRLKLSCLLAVFALYAAPASAEVKIGVGTGLTGPHAAMGAQMNNGVEQAVADLNAKGGILGEQIVVVPGDDRSDPKEAVSVAQKLISDDVKIVIGHLTSGATAATVKEYADAGVLMVTPSATSPAITEQGLWNVFRVIGRDDQQGEYAAEYILKNDKDKKIAIVHDKGSYGKPLADVVKTALNKGGVTEVLYDGINPGEKDYSALVSKLKNLNVDVVYFGGYYAEAGLITRQLRDQGSNIEIIGGDGLANAELGQIAGEGVIGTKLTFTPDPANSPAAKPIVDALKAKNIDPSGFTLSSYAAIQVVAQAAEEAKSLEPKKIADVLHSGKTFSTVIGDVSYDSKGDLQKAGYVMYDWKKDNDGKLVYTEISTDSQ